MLAPRLIDVSEHQPPGAMRWPQWRDLGYAGVIIRAGIGGRLDLTGPDHRERARAARYLTGSYWALHEAVAPETQARLYAGRAYADDELICWLDVERAGLTERHVAAFLDEWERVTDFPIGIYTSAPAWHRIVGRGTRAYASRLPLWVAGYPFDAPDSERQPMDPVSVALRSTPPHNRFPVLPDPWSGIGYRYWQHTGHGTLPGYASFLDLNVAAAVIAPPAPVVDLSAPLAAIRAAAGEIERLVSHSPTVAG